MAANIKGAHVIQQLNYIPGIINLPAYYTGRKVQISITILTLYGIWDCTVDDISNSVKRA